MASESGNDHHDPQFEPTNAKRRIAEGEFDMGTRIASAEFLSRPENVYFQLALAGNPDVTEEQIAQVQEGRRRALVDRVLMFLGDDGELPLAHGLRDLRSVIEGFPKSSPLFDAQPDFLRALEEFDVSLAEFTTGGYEPGNIPLTPQHIQNLQRLRVATFELIKGLLPAIQYYGALMNYGETLEAPAYTLMDLRDSLLAGDFLKEFTKAIRERNKLTEQQVLIFLQKRFVPQLMVALTEAAQRHGIEVTSLNAICELVPLAFRDAKEDADKERDGFIRAGKERLAAALFCISKNLPDSIAELSLEREELDEGGFPIGLETDEDEEGAPGDAGFNEGNPDAWKS